MKPLLYRGPRHGKRADWLGRRRPKFILCDDIRLFGYYIRSQYAKFGPIYVYLGRVELP